MKNLFVVITVLIALTACDSKKVTDIADACKSAYYSSCQEGDVYLFNICGEVIGKVEECSENEKCEEDECVTCEATSDCAQKSCYEGDVYCFNDCGK
ncbi:MAG TPA: hypothetical protein VLJ60_03265, partial [bacterium]|nr:hypothetical protein [bacterium]